MLHFLFVMLAHAAIYSVAYKLLRHVGLGGGVAFAAVAVVLLLIFHRRRRRWWWR